MVFRASIEVVFGVRVFSWEGAVFFITAACSASPYRSSAILLVLMPGEKR